MRSTFTLEHMARPRTTPPDERLRQYVEQGLSLSGMIDSWFEESGQMVTKQGMGQALKRAGLKANGSTEAYYELRPWRVLPEHLMENPLRMLRAEARYRRGLPLQPREQKTREHWLRDLNAENAVVGYHPDRGFYYTDREPDDFDIICEKSVPEPERTRRREERQKAS